MLLGSSISYMGIEYFLKVSVLNVDFSIWVCFILSQIREVDLFFWVLVFLEAASSNIGIGYCIRILILSVKYFWDFQFVLRVLDIS